MDWEIPPLVIHEVTPALVALHRRTGDGRLLRALGHFSVGQSREALHALAAGDSRATGSLEGAALLTILDPEYPTSLRALGEEAPPFLYVLGNVSRLRAKTIAIIGTRRPSPEGRAAARTMAAECARAGWCVVSGNAPGVDAAGHDSSVRSGGETLIFPPAPVDSYRQCFRGKFPDQVTVASCFAPGTAVDPWLFLRRNSLVAAHCRAAFVAETATRGGTLDTVRKLNRLGRAVFATELSESATHCRAHALLQASGAQLIEVEENGRGPALIIQAAEECLRRPAPRMPVLDDFFSEEFLQND